MSTRDGYHQVAELLDELLRRELQLFYGQVGLNRRAARVALMLLPPFACLALDAARHEHNQLQLPPQPKRAHAYAAPRTVQQPAAVLIGCAAYVLAKLHSLDLRFVDVEQAGGKPRCSQYVSRFWACRQFPPDATHGVWTRAKAAAALAHAPAPQHARTRRPSCAHCRAQIPPRSTRQRWPSKQQRQRRPHPPTRRTQCRGATTRSALSPFMATCGTSTTPCALAWFAAASWQVYLHTGMGLTGWLAAVECTSVAHQ